MPATLYFMVYPPEAVEFVPQGHERARLPLARRRDLAALAMMKRREAGIITLLWCGHGPQHHSFSSTWMADTRNPAGRLQYKV